MPLCGVGDCGKPIKSLGFCRLHYLRNYRHGSPEPKALKTKFVGLSIDERFLKYVLPMPGEDGCWLWTGGVNNTGYGQFNFNGKTRLATHVSLELFSTALPEGMYALHRCDTPRCVSPKHLFAGTAQENTDDMFTKGRNKPWEQRRSSKLSPQLAEQIRMMSGSYVGIAKIFGVDPSTVSNVKTYKTWRG